MVCDTHLELFLIFLPLWHLYKDSQTFLINATWIKITLIYPRGYTIDMIIESFSSIATIMGGGFFADILIGWAVKKLIKLFAITAGLLLSGLAYLQYQQIAPINWNKLEQVLEEVVNTFVNATTKMIDGGHSEIAGLANNKLWYSYDKQYINRIYDWFYERTIIGC
jgi:uncharacterized membrane protein (Fun14 family)